MTAPSLESIQERLGSRAERVGLAKFVADVALRQASSRVRFSGRDFVRLRAEAHGVTAADAETPWGSVLDIVERGPASEDEEGVLAVLAAWGSGDDPILEVRHAAWLAAAHGSRWLEALVSGVMGTPAHRDAARAFADRELVSSDLSLRAQAWLAREALGEAPTATSATARASGTLEPAPRRGVRRVLAWMTGYALVESCIRWLLAMLGRSGQATIEVSGGKLVLRGDSGIAGASLLALGEVGDVRALGWQSRHAATPIVLGAVAFAAGVLVGGPLVFDGVRSGEYVLLAIGCAIATSGIALELALSAYATWRRGPALLRIESASGTWVLRTRREAAEELLDAAVRSLPRG